MATTFGLKAASVAWKVNLGSRLGGREDVPVLTLPE